MNDAEKAYQSMNPEVLQELRETQREEMGAVAPKRVGTPFKKGESGNPMGRPVGSKNKTTLVKEAVMAEGTDIILRNAPKVIQAVVDQALSGCKASQKLIWNSLVPSRKSEEGVQGKESRAVTINIQGMESRVREAVTIEAEENE